MVRDAASVWRRNKGKSTLAVYLMKIALRVAALFDENFHDPILADILYDGSTVAVTHSLLFHKGGAERT